MKNNMNEETYNINTKCNQADRSGRVSVKHGLDSYFSGIGKSDEVVKKAFRIAHINTLFKQCMSHIYKDSSYFILENTNAVYVLKERDKGFRKKPLPGDKHIKRMVIYLSNSMVHADLDSRQEFIKHWFHTHGEHIDKIDFLTARLGMRRRHPFKDDVEFMKKSLQIGQQGSNNNQNLKPSMSEEQKNQFDSNIENIANPRLKQALKNLVD